MEISLVDSMRSRQEEQEQSPKEGGGSSLRITAAAISGAFWIVNLGIAISSFQCKVSRRVSVGDGAHRPDEASPLPTQLAR